MDIGTFFALPSVKAALIIGSVVILVLLALCILDKSCCCCLVSTKAGNYEYNMERLERGNSEEKEPSAPMSDSNGFYMKNVREFNDK